MHLLLILLSLFCIDPELDMDGAGGVLPQIIYVPDDYVTIQEAIINAKSGKDMVFVRDGTYYENIDFLHKAITLKSMNGPSNCVIDGQQKGAVVSFKNGENRFARLHGFTITNGTGAYFKHSGFYRNCGGGIYIYNAEPKITNCVIIGNSVNQCPLGEFNRGGGVYVGAWGLPTCSRITLNDAIIRGCVICGNYSGSVAGGVYLSAAGYGAAFKNNRVYQNEADHLNGSDIYIYGPYYNFDSNEIGPHAGGAPSTGLHAYSNIPGSGTIIFTNNIFHDYPTSNGMIGCFISGYRIVHLTNNTLMDYYYWGLCISAAHNQYCDSYLYNNIFYRNGLYSPVHLSGGACVMRNNCVEGGVGDVELYNCQLDYDHTNISDYPYVDPDYHLLSNSPCIDTGTSDAPWLPAKDIDGDKRVINKAPDMGADERK